MTDQEIEQVILFVADKAWEIASNGGASGEVCRAIEALSDDPMQRKALAAAARLDLQMMPARKHGRQQ